MENELRYYLKNIKLAMEKDPNDDGTMLGLLSHPIL